MMRALELCRTAFLYTNIETWGCSKELRWIQSVTQGFRLAGKCDIDCEAAFAQITPANQNRNKFRQIASPHVILRDLSMAPVVHLHGSDLRLAMKTQTEGAP